MLFCTVKINYQATLILLNNILFIILFSFLSACSDGSKVDEKKLVVIDNSSENNFNRLPDKWFKEAVFMEIFIRSYKDSDGDGIGDFKGLTSKLDYLKELGIGGIWLLPITRSSDHNHGYSIESYRSVEPDYGTLDDFKVLLKEAHKRGIGIIVDYVMNHSSSKNPLFIDASNKNSDIRDWYIWSDTAKNWPRWDGLNTWHENNSGFFYGIFGQDYPDFNLKNPDVINYHLNNLDFWLDLGVDGFRLDATGVFIENGKNSMVEQKESYEITKKVRDKLDKKHGKFLICESPESAFSSNDSCGHSFYFGMHIDIVETVINKYFSSSLIERASASIAKELAIFITNHDTFVGDRLIRQVKGDADKLKLAAALQLTLPGMPFIYYGDEIGMGRSGGVHGTLGIDYDNMLRAPMSWSADLYAGFSTEKPFISIAENYTTHNTELQIKDVLSIYNFYKKIIFLRNGQKALQYGDFVHIPVGRSDLLLFERKLEDDVIVVAINFGDDLIEGELQGLPNSQWLSLLPDDHVSLKFESNGVATLLVKGKNINIYKYSKGN